MLFMLLQDRCRKGIEDRVPVPFFSDWLDPDPQLYLALVPLEMHFILLQIKSERNRESDPDPFFPIGWIRNRNCIFHLFL